MTKLNINTSIIKGPLYLHIADTIERDVFSGKLNPGDQLPSQRDLAARTGINVSTVTRGYREAERRGLLSGTVGSGTFIASDATTGISMISTEPRAPGLLELGLVTPLTHLEPDISDTLIRLARSGKKRNFMEYTSPAGLPSHREAGALWARRFAVTADADDIIVAAGSQHALTCILTACFSHGDRIAVDALTYPGLKSTAALLGIRLIPVDLDSDGMIPKALEIACRREQMKGLYLMPGMQNPTTACLSAKRRDLIADLAEENNLLVIEDDAYFHTVKNPPDSLFNRIPERCIFLAGISKAFGAGLRISFIVAGKPHRKVLTEAVLNTIWMAPPLCGEIASLWIRNGTAEKIIKEKEMEAEERNRLAVKMLSGYKLAATKRGYFAWLELPDEFTGQMVETAARERGINIFCAERFAVGGGTVPRAVRVSLTGPSSAKELERGLKNLKEILTGESHFTPVM